MIDGRNKTKPEMFAKFYDTITNKVIINVELDKETWHHETTKDNFLNYIVNEQINVPDNAEIHCISDKEEFVFAKSDFDYWRTNTRRKNNILNCLVVNPKVVDESIKYYIGVGIYTEGKLSNISDFEGSKKEAIQFINQQIVSKSIDSFLKQKIMVNLTYDKTKPINLEEWFTLDDLADMGAITLQ